MQALVLTGINQMEMREEPAPEIQGDNDVLLKLGVVGVCGSDVHYYETGKIGSQVVQYPFRVGHECAATVEAVGAGVKNVQPGDRVAVEPAMPCHACDQCRAGREHTCRNLRFLGCPGQADGCLCEYIVMPSECCHPVSDNMTLEQAALSEPLAIGYYGVKMSVPMEGAKIGILGSGPIGLSVMACARALGAETIYMTDRIGERCDLAAQHGADWTGNPDKTDVVREIVEKEPLLLDAVYECAGQQETIDQAIAMLKPGGKLLLIGIPREDRISFVIDQMRRKEICVQNIRRQNECLEPTLELLESKKVDVDFMVTHRFKAAETQKAFDLVEHYQDGIIKAMVHFDS